MRDLEQVFSLTDLHRHHWAQLNQLWTSIVLTIKGKPALVLQDAAGHQELLDRLELAESRSRGDAS